MNQCEHTLTIKKASRACSKFGMVATASRHATDVGAEILEKGGNAVDAAVASAFCLSVTEPQASGLGGQSMVLLYLNKTGKAICLDGSSRAPYSLPFEINFFESQKRGILSATLPSTVAVLGYLLDSYGRLTIKQVLDPVIRYARDGYPVTALQHRLLTREIKTLIKDPLVKHIFFNDGKAIKAGNIIRQAELAGCLERIASAGWQDFYHGETSEKIIKDMSHRGGLISSLDLHRIPVPIEKIPLKGEYRHHRFITFPPPGAGRSLVQIMNILERFDPSELCKENILSSLIFSMAFRTTLRDRHKMPADPILFSQMQNKLMLDKGYAGELAEIIRNKIERSAAVSFVNPVTSGETTHLSVADSEGNAIGITQSIEKVFGSRTMSQDLGFFYNNYMTAFNFKDITHPYYLLPGAKPWSSVAPTLIFDKEKPGILLGSPGSERISTSLAQVISLIIDSGYSLAEAIEAPRLHADAGGRVQIEKRRFDTLTNETLKRMGFEITRRGAYSFYLGCVQAVRFPRVDDDFYIGVSDPRRDGTAKGPKYIRS